LKDEHDDRYQRYSQQYNATATSQYAPSSVSAAQVTALTLPYPSTMRVIKRPARLGPIPPQYRQKKEDWGYLCLHSIWWSGRHQIAPAPPGPHKGKNKKGYQRMTLNTIDNFHPVFSLQCVPIEMLYSIDKRPKLSFQRLAYLRSDAKNLEKWGETQTRC